MVLKSNSLIYTAFKYLWAVIDSYTQIMAVNQVRLLPNESGVFFVVSY